MLPNAYYCRDYYSCRVVGAIFFVTWRRHFVFLFTMLTILCKYTMQQTGINAIYTGTCCIVQQVQLTNWKFAIFLIIKMYILTNIFRFFQRQREEYTFHSTHHSLGKLMYFWDVHQYYNVLYKYIIKPVLISDLSCRIAACICIVAAIFKSVCLYCTLLDTRLLGSDICM
jgi:hypothetical protein